MKINKFNKHSIGITNYICRGLYYYASIKLGFNLEFTQVSHFPILSNTWLLNVVLIEY